MPGSGRAHDPVSHRLLDGSAVCTAGVQELNGARKCFFAGRPERPRQCWVRLGPLRGTHVVVVVRRNSAAEELNSHTGNATREDSPEKGLHLAPLQPSTPSARILESVHATITGAACSPLCEPAWRPGGRPAQASAPRYRACAPGPSRGSSTSKALPREARQRSDSPRAPAASTCNLSGYVP